MLSPTPRTSSHHLSHNSMPPSRTTLSSTRSRAATRLCFQVYVRCSRIKSSRFRGLRTLKLSCSFFSDSDPLFSIACALFDKNTGGGIPLPDSGAQKRPLDLNTFRINTCKSVSKQTPLTSFGINTCEKPGEGEEGKLSISNRLPRTQRKPLPQLSTVNTFALPAALNVTACSHQGDTTPPQCGQSMSEPSVTPSTAHHKLQRRLS
jgi:hypothetical protein